FVDVVTHAASWPLYGTGRPGRRAPAGRAPFAHRAGPPENHYRRGGADRCLRGADAGARIPDLNISELPAAVTAKLSLQDLSVLLVEPSLAQSRIIGDRLRRVGVESVEIAASGGQALEFMRTH